MVQGGVRGVRGRGGQVRGQRGRGRGEGQQADADNTIGDSFVDEAVRR